MKKDREKMRLFKMKNAEAFIGISQGKFYYLCLFPNGNKSGRKHDLLPLNFKPNMKLYERVTEVPVYTTIPKSYTDDRRFL